MKTPDEIKHGLKCCAYATCNGCPYAEDGCATNREMIDALEYIQQLEKEHDALLAGVGDGFSLYELELQHAADHLDLCIQQQHADLLGLALTDGGAMDHGDQELLQGGSSMGEVIASRRGESVGTGGDGDQYGFVAGHGTDLVQWVLADSCDLAVAIGQVIAGLLLDGFLGDGVFVLLLYFHIVIDEAVVGGQIDM